MGRKTVRGKKKNKKQQQDSVATTNPYQLTTNRLSSSMEIILTNMTKYILSDTEACVTPTEAQDIVEAILLDNDYHNEGMMTMADTDNINSMASLLCDYLPEMSITLDEAKSLVERSITLSQENDENDEDECNIESFDFTCVDDKIQCYMTDGDEDDEESIGDYIQDGECELCERYMKLTRHHLIPKSTWNKMKQRVVNNPSHYLDGEMTSETNDKGEVIDETIPTLSSKDVVSKSSVKLFLASYTSSICRPCHSIIHRYFTNMELAENYNTVDKLLEDERVVKFCKWANKQRPGKHKYM